MGARARIWRALAASLVASFPTGTSADSTDYIPQFAEYELETLLQQEVTSVLRKEQSLVRAPADITVVTAEDIRRMGATSIPEALRGVPGLTVLRSTSSSWVISARGFDSHGSSKLLVLIDGRSVYSPLTSDVFWDVQDVLLEDIERIEVIRGPGAVSWGENAVNGVINIITKSAKDTQGALVSGGGGKEERAFVSVRQGGTLGEDTDYRVYGKYFDRDEFARSGGGGAEDEWRMGRGGVRIDARPDAASAFTFQAEGYGGEEHGIVGRVPALGAPNVVLEKDNTQVAGAFARFRYHEEFAEDSKFTLRGYYDHTERSSITFAEQRDTFDIDAQHQVRPFEGHDVVYGINARVTTDETRSSVAVEIEPSGRTDPLVTAFVQDEISLIDDVLSVIPGTKLGYNNYTGFEYQPALKAVYTLNQHNSLWSSIARAVRIPARIDDDIRINLPVPLEDGSGAVVAVRGSRDFDAEELWAYELGIRMRPNDDVILQSAVFYHQYDSLLSLEPKNPFVEQTGDSAYLVVPVDAANDLQGNAYGVTLSGDWKAAEAVRVSANYSYIDVTFRNDPDGMDVLSLGDDRETPHHQANAMLSIDLPYDLQFDAMVYYRDTMPARSVSSYVQSNFRVGWRASKALEIDAILQNAFDDQHRETAGGSEIQRAVFGRVTYRFGR